MILLNFWPAHLLDRVGHVSLLIGAGQSEAQQTYVSWWPGKNDGSKELGVPVQPYTYDQDVVAESGPPSGRVSISGLDEARMKRTWQALLAKKTRYYLLRRNCAWTVKVVLDAGTGLDMASITADYLNSRVAMGVWTPRTVFEYASRLKNSHSDVPQKRFDRATNSPSGLIAS